MPLTEERRSQLDNIVHQMVSNGEPDDAVQFVVNDFKSKYEAAPAPAPPPMSQQQAGAELSRLASGRENLGQPTSKPSFLQPQRVAPFYEREKPIPGTEQTGLPGVPNPAPLPLPRSDAEISAAQEGVDIFPNGSSQKWRDEDPTEAHKALGDRLGSLGRGVGSLVKDTGSFLMAEGSNKNGLNQFGHFAQNGEESPAHAAGSSLEGVGKAIEQQFPRTSPAITKSKTLPEFLAAVTDSTLENLPNMLATLGAGELGLAARGIRGAQAAAFATSYVLNTGDTYAALREQGHDIPEAAEWAGLPMAALDVIGPLDMVLGPGKAVATWKDVIKRGARVGAEEAGGEMGQEAIQIGTEALANKKLPDAREALGRIAEAGAASLVPGIGGGLHSGVSVKESPQQTEMRELRDSARTGTENANAIRMSRVELARKLQEEREKGPFIQRLPNAEPQEVPNATSQPAPIAEAIQPQVDPQDEQRPTLPAQQPGPESGGAIPNSVSPAPQTEPDRIVAGEGEQQQPEQQVGQVDQQEPPAPPPQITPEQAAALAKTPHELARLSEQTFTMNPADIEADPVRMQFKLNAGGKAGVTDELSDVEWNKDLAGPVSVWVDPENSKVYVVNGHHRLDLAKRKNVPNIDVRFLDAKSAPEARAMGALQNIAEGRGTAIDAARFMRDTGISAEDLSKSGVALKGEKARFGSALAKLPNVLFDQVVSEELPVERAVIIGEGLNNHMDMLAAADLMNRAGKNLNNSQLRELIRRVAGAERRTEVQDTLFGQEEMTQNLAVEEAQLSDYVRNQIAKEKRLFSTVGSQAAASSLQEGGNVINVDRNKAMAEAAQIAINLYDRLSLRSGPISDALREGARRLAAGESATLVKEQTYGAVRKAVQETLAGGEGSRVGQPEELPAAPAGDDRTGNLFGDSEPAESGPVANSAPPPRNDRQALARRAKEAAASRKAPQSETLARREDTAQGPPSTPAPAGTPKKPVQPAKEIQSRSRVQRELERTLAAIDGLFMLRVGKFKQRALGIYKITPEVIRLKTALDLPTLFHEVGHHINKMLWGKSPRGGLAVAQFKPYSKELKDLDYDQKARREYEGFAEFLRYWFTDPAQAQARAPKFSVFWEDTLKANPTLGAGLYAARDRFVKWSQQPAAARILGSINKEGSKRKTWFTFGSYDDFYTRNVSEHHPLFQAVEAMNRMSGRTVPSSRNAAKLAQLGSGWWGKAKLFLENGTFDFHTKAKNGEGLESILEPVAKQGREIGNFSKDLLGGDAMESYDDGLDDLRVYVVAKRALEKSAQGKQTGIKREDAKIALQEMKKRNADRFDVLENAAKRLYDYQNRVLDYVAQAGGIDLPSLERISKANEFYVPFYRVFEEEKGDRGGRAASKQMADAASPIKRFVGSEREIVDPLESVIKNTYMLISFADRNYVAQSLWKQAERTDGAGRYIEEVDIPSKPIRFNLEEIRKAIEATGADLEDADMDVLATIYRPQTGVPAGHVSIVVDGKKRIFKVSDELYQALHNSDMTDANVIWRIIAMPAKLLRAGATGMNPEFNLTNIMRDAMTAFMQSEYGFRPGIDTLIGLKHVLKEDEIYREWQASGGEHGALVSLDRDNLQKNLKTLIEHGPLDNVRHPIEALRMLSEFSEAATRVGAYARAKNKGAGMVDAAIESRNATLDFSRIGRDTKLMNRVVAFQNAAIQGLDTFVRLHNPKNPAVLKRTMLRGVLGVTIPSLILHALNSGDSDYEDLPRWQKDLFWMIPTKGTPLSPAIKWIRIPKPFLYGMTYGTFPERFMDWLKANKPEAYKDYAENLINMATPPVLPSGVTPIIEAMANFSFFTGAPIEGSANERLSPEYRAKPSTSEWARKAAPAISKSTGLHISPDKLDHIYFGYTAGLGRTVSRLAVDPAVRAMTGKNTQPPALHVSEYPVLRALTGGEPASQAVTDFYEEFHRLDQRSQDAKKVAGAQQLNRVEQARFNRLKEAAKQIKDNTKSINEIRASKADPKVKRDKIDKIVSNSADIAKRAIQ